MVASRTGPVDDGAAMGWYLQANGQQQGPLDEAAIVDMIRSGDLRDGQIASEGGQGWQPLASHPAFAEALGGGQPASFGSATVAMDFGAMQGFGAAPAAGIAATQVGEPAMGGPGIGAPPAPAGGPPMGGPPMGGPPMGGGYPPPMGGPAMGGGYPPPIGMGPAGRPGAKGPPIKLIAGVGGGGFVLLVLIIVVVVLATRVSAKLVTAEVGGDEQNVLTLVIESKKGTMLKADVLPAVKDTNLEADSEGKITAKLDLSKQPMGKTKLVLRVVKVDNHDKGVDLPLEIERKPFIKLAEHEYNSADIECFGKTCKGKLWTDGSLDLDVEDGAVATINGTAGTASGGKLRVKANLDGPLLAATQDQIFDSTAARNYRFDFPLSLKFADGTTLARNVKGFGGWLKSYLARRARAIDSGPVAFTGDDAATSLRAVLYVGISTKIIGAAAKMSHLDAIAKSRTSIRNGSCGTYRNTRTGVVVSIGKKMYDHTLTLYNRRNGQQMATRKFLAVPPACPQTMSSSTKDVAGFVRDEDEENWLKTFLGKAL